MAQPDTHARVAHICPTCGAIRHLRPADAARTRHCRQCHCERIAPLGFAATAASKGRDFAIRAAAAKRKAHPSSLEAQVEAALRTLPGVIWEREVAVERDGALPYFVDFVVLVSGQCVALEVNGAYVHRHDGEHSERLEVLRQRFDRVIILTEAALKQAADLPAHLAQVLA